MHRAPLLLLLASTIVACKSPDPDPEREELLDWLDMYDDAVAASWAVQCECPNLVGYTSVEECEAFDPTLTPAQKECFADAYEGKESEAIEYTSCLIDVTVELMDCIAAAAESCDSNAWDACGEAYDLAWPECTPPDAGIDCYN